LAIPIVHRERRGEERREDGGGAITIAGLEWLK